MQRRPAAAPRRPAPAVVSRLPLPLLLPLTPAVDALSRGEGYGVLAVPLLSATLKLTSQLNRGDNVADTVTVSSLTHQPNVTFTEYRCVLSTKSISTATFFSWSNRAGLCIAQRSSPSSGWVPECSSPDLHIDHRHKYRFLIPLSHTEGGWYSIKSFFG